MFNNVKILFDSERRGEDIPGAIKKLTKILGSERVSIKNVDKLAYGKDFWLLANSVSLKGVQPSMPDVVVWPKTIDEVSQIIKLANQHKLPVIPYGEGSGVVGGALAIHGGIIVDMKYFESIEINAKNMTVTAGAGINGMDLERKLNEQGFRMGHIPQSVRTSTLGGYIAHRAAGQFSGVYGKIEDIVMSMEVVLPDGSIMQSKTYSKAAVGPMVDRIFLGNEGALGIVTKATCKIWPMPEKVGKLSYVFDQMQDCLDAIRETIQARINPGVVRIYDIAETERHFGTEVKKSKGKIMVVFVFEGNTRLVDLEMQITAENCLKYNGLSTGEKPVDHWYHTRFNVSASNDIAKLDLVGDTIELSCMWEVANETYEKVIEAVKSVPGVIMATSHASHFYTTGVCWYFTFVAVAKEGQDHEELYHQCWDSAMRAVLKLNGSISHHHGLGLNRTKWMKLEHPMEWEFLLKVKKMLDPNNIMNPGKIFDEENQVQTLEEEKY